jgi:hypothetical protein
MGKLANIPGANLVAKINTAHRQAAGHFGKVLDYATECGRLLKEAKALVPHGEWLPWLSEHTEVSERSSQRYMQIADNWSAIQLEIGKSDTVADLDLGLNGALKLIAKPKPKPKPEPKPEPIEPVGAVEPDGELEPEPEPVGAADDDGDDEGGDPGDIPDCLDRRGGAEEKNPSGHFNIAPGIDAARRHYAAEFARLPASQHDAETTRLVNVLRDAAT